MIEHVTLGFGSNIGNRLKNIQTAVKIISLTKGFDLLALSSIYETEPWGFKKQKKFLNSCGVFLCRLSPSELLNFVKQTETAVGRVNRSKWQAREIDIDILFYGSRTYNGGKLIIPHPFIRERNFVLKPLVELMPGFIHPKLNKNIGEIYRASKDNCAVSLYREIK